MIGSIEGIVELKDFPHIVVNVSGVGYRVLVSNNFSSGLKIGDKTKLFTYTHVREDILELYGFLTMDELKLFEKLISVSGVGPKTAVGIFSFGTKDEVVLAIIKGDVEFFTRVPRLGRKNAQKIIIELKEKLGSTDSFDLSGDNQKENNEIAAALKNFGFTASEAREAIRTVGKEGKTIEEKIRLALRTLSK